MTMTQNQSFKPNKLSKIKVSMLSSHCHFLLRSVKVLKIKSCYILSYKCFYIRFIPKQYHAVPPYDAKLTNQIITSHVLCKYLPKTLHLADYISFK